MSVPDQKYKILHDEITKLGICDQSKIDRLIDELNSLSDVLIDMFIESENTCKE